MNLMDEMYEWLAFVLAVFIGYAAIKYFANRRVRAARIYDVVIHNGEIRIELKGFYDSGNQLMDPYTGCGVNIVNASRISSIACEGNSMVRCVPFVSLGEHEGLIAAFTVDELKILDGSNEASHKNVVMGMADGKLFEGKEYDVILHASMI